jgi:hypothetical protein
LLTIFIFQHKKRRFLQEKVTRVHKNPSSPAVRISASGEGKQPRYQTAGVKGKFFMTLTKLPIFKFKSIPQSQIQPLLCEVPTGLFLP